jgi:drug/metabolite transporter (DMT)-like permease
VQIALALFATFAWGGSSIFAARGSRASTALAVTVWSQIIGLVLALPVLGLLGTGGFTWREAVHGAFAGTGSGLSLLLLYQSSRTLYAGVAAALSAATACTIPVIYTGIRSTTSPREILGAAVCLVALAAVGTWHRDGVVSAPAASPVEAGGASVRRRGVSVRIGGVGTALLSGVGMSVYYIALTGTSARGQIHSAFESRAVATVMLCLIAAATSPPILRLTRPRAVTGALVGVTGMAGTLAYAGSVSAGNLAVIVPVVSLSPAVTIVLGRIFLGEATSRRQTVGLVLAMLGVLLVTS